MSLTIAVGVVYLGFDFAYPFLPLYVHELGVESVGEIALWSGLLIGIAPGIGTLVNPFWGVMADRFGAKRMILRALAIFSVLLVLMGMVTNVWQLLALRAAVGILGGFAPLTVAMTVAAAPRGQAAQALGVLQIAQFLPMALGPTIGGQIADRLGLRMNFFVAAGMCVTGLLLIIVLLRHAPSAAPKVAGEARAPTAPVRQLLRTPDFLLPFCLLFIAYFVDRSFLPVMPLYVTVLGAPAEAVAFSAGLVLAGGAVATAASGPLLGRLAGRFPLPQLIAAALGSGLLACLLIAMAGNLDQLLVLRLTLGVLAGGLPTLAYALGSRGVAQSSLGRQAGLLTSATLLATACGPIITGVIAAWRLRAVFVVDAILLSLALVFVVARGEWRVASTGDRRETR